MNHLLRKTLNKSPDSERLLTPRKSLFGKTKKGTRSEDEPDPSSNSYTNASSAVGGIRIKNVFKPTMRRPEKEVAPPLAGTPKTAPPSPETNGGVLVVTGGMDDAAGLGTDGEETVMSDLTGTVAPPEKLPAGVTTDATAGPPPMTPLKAKPLQQPSSGTGTGTGTPPHLSTGSYCSAYSPSLEAFQQQQQHQQQPQDGSSNNNNGVDHHQVQERNFYCESSVLESMLGVVDGACHQGLAHMGVVVSSHDQHDNAETASHQLKEPGRPLWGVAPSEDDEDSTTFAAGAASRGGTKTAAAETNTRDTTTHNNNNHHNNHQSGDSTADNTSARNSSAANTSSGSISTNRMDATNVAAGRSSFIPSQLSNIAEDSVDDEAEPAAAAGASSEQQEEEEVGHHENYEMVLGQTDLSGGGCGEKDTQDESKSSSKGSKRSNRSSSSNWEKKNGANKEGTDSAAKERRLSLKEIGETSQKLRGWVSRHLSPKRNRSDDDDAPHAAEAIQTKAVEPITVAELRKQEQTTADKQLQLRSAPVPDKRKAAAVVDHGKPPPVPSVANKSSKQHEELYQSVFGDDPPRDGRDVGVEIQSKRIQERPFTPSRVRGSSISVTARSRSSRSSTPSRLSGFVKKIKTFPGVKRHKNSNELLPPKSPEHRGVHVPAKRTPKPETLVAAAEPSWLQKQQQDEQVQSLPKTQPIKQRSSPPRPTTQKQPPQATKVRLQRPAEEEKKEIEPQDVAIVEPGQGGGEIAMKHDFPNTTASSSQLTAPEASAMASEKDSSPATRKFTFLDQPEISRVQSKPATESVRGLGGVSVVSHDPSPTRKNKQDTADGGIENVDDMTNGATLSRLRSAPTTLSTAELLNQKPKLPPKLEWKATKDGKGRTYYYHRATRETTWQKPGEFDAQVAAVLKYKEDMEKAKKAAEERQQVIDGCKNLEALRKKSKRDFDPRVWETKQKIMDIVKTIPLPTGTNIEKLLVQYDGREEQLLGNLRDLVESKPFDEPFQAPSAEVTKRRSQEDKAQADTSAVNTSFLTASSQSSTAYYSAVDVHSRVRTAVSASTRFSEKTNITEKTEKIRNTGPNIPGGIGIDTIREIGMSTGSISSAANSPARAEDAYPSYPASGRVPSNIPAGPRSPARSVPRSRDLKVEVFAKEGIAKETYNDALLVVPPSSTSKPAPAPQVSTVPSHPHSMPAIEGTRDTRRSISPDPPEGARGKTLLGVTKAVTLHNGPHYTLDTDDDSYNGDYDDTVDDTAASEKIADSISALSETDADYAAQKENFEKARRRALDVAVEREDWDLAAALSEGMRQVKHSLYGKSEQKEWTQTELDRFISENDWDAVSKYIAHMRDHPGTSTPANSKSSAVHTIPVLAAKKPPRARDPEGSVASETPPNYVSEATKRASQHTQSGRRETAASQESSSSSRNQPAQKRFGARSQLQHQDLNSVSSWDNSTQSSYDSEFTDGSYESDDEQGYISLRVRRNEFEC